MIEAHPYVKSRLVTDENGEVVFEDHSEDEFHTSVFEIADIEDVRAHLGEDYDLMHDQLFRLEIYKTQNGYYLYVDFHHIVFDGMSFAVFRADVAKAYAGEPLEGEPMNGFQIAEAEVAVRNSDVYQEAKEWYEKEFGGATEVESMPLADVYDVADEHFITVWNQLSIGIRIVKRQHGNGASQQQLHQPCPCPSWFPLERDLMGLRQPFHLSHRHP